MDLLLVYFYILYLVNLNTAQVPLTPNEVCLPNPPSMSAERLSPPFSTCDQATTDSLGDSHPDQNKLTPEILQKYRYPFKEYNVTTRDGYILTVYRITGSPKLRQQKGKKQAVYVQHGLLAASDCWNFQPDSRNLPFKLADAGYEVWLGNARGTTYSTGHKKYNSDVDLAYWDFSYHEMGIYDVPAVTDKIIQESKNKKIFYIGHSMGSTMYFVSLSEISKMNDKILAGFMLAPIAFVGHCNMAARLAFPLINTDILYQAVNIAFQGRLRTAQEFRTMFRLSPGDICDLTATKCGVCDNLLFLFFGYDAPQMNNTELPNIFTKVPNQVSIKTFAHYAQSGTFCTFRKYDYGPIVNPNKYKSITAPDYALDKIRAPTYFFYGENDNLGPPNDVNITASKFKKGVIRGMYRVQSDLWNHVDFLTAKDGDKYVYNKILAEMKKFK